MTPLKEIGECLVIDGDDEYFFRPSLIAMSSIGEPGEIVSTFHALHSDAAKPLLRRAYDAYGAIPHWVIDHARRPEFTKPAIYAAMDVLTACCNRDASPLVGVLVPSKTKKRTFLYRPGKMPAADIIIFAHSLMTHGIIGKAQVRRLQRHEGGQTTSEFNAFEYISAARNHFGMSRSEAEQLTMTEFTMLLAAKYPDQKGFTRDEYDKVADDYFERKAKRLGKVA
ncbi:DUF6246 family protein [Pantoea sp. Z09]|uniref:DUF6246 family protein n=1 Tax=Pantoea sp. Z09 TaxID=2886821 RepID=UPI001EFE967B|nr:DUF6246 family protein [Pantoea sp. Z09]